MTETPELNRIKLRDSKAKVKQYLTGPLQLIERCPTVDLRNDPILTADIKSLVSLQERFFGDLYPLACSVIEGIQS